VHDPVIIPWDYVPDNTVLARAVGETPITLREEVRPIKSEIGIYDFAKYDFAKYINFQCKTH
jgi:hypothetical protein